MSDARYARTGYTEVHVKAGALPDRPHASSHQCMPCRRLQVCQLRDLDKVQLHSHDIGAPALSVFRWQGIQRAQVALLIAGTGVPILCSPCAAPLLLCLPGGHAAQHL